MTDDQRAHFRHLADRLRASDPDDRGVLEAVAEGTGHFDRMGGMHFDAATRYSLPCRGCGEHVLIESDELMRRLEDGPDLLAPEGFTCWRCEERAVLEVPSWLREGGS